MIRLDHISINVQNHYEAAIRLRGETGFGFYDGGTLGPTSANKIMPLGGSNYIEIVGTADPYKWEANHEQHPDEWMYNLVKTGDHFGGLCLRVDSQQELEDLAKMRGWTPPHAGGRMRPSGIFLPWMSTPSPSPWSKGLPNVYFWPDMTQHPSGQPTEPAPGLTRPLGVTWIEVGGSEADMKDWLGVPLDAIPFRYNGEGHGLYAVAVKTDKGEVVIRRKSAAEA
jgi:hypothetical protein